MSTVPLRLPPLLLLLLFLFISPPTSSIPLPIALRQLTPLPIWRDSYAVGGRCYCITTYDHNIANILVDTPLGPRTVFDVCNDLGPGPGVADNPVYNDIQCGNGPANDAGDEDVCPGRVDLGVEGCSDKGPKWDLSFYTTDANVSQESDAASAVESPVVESPLPSLSIEPSPILISSPSAEPSASAELVPSAEPILSSTPSTSAEPSLSTTPSSSAVLAPSIEPALSPEPSLPVEPLLSAEPSLAASPPPSDEPALSPTPLSSLVPSPSSDPALSLLTSSPTPSEDVEVEATPNEELLSPAAEPAALAIPGLIQAEDYTSNYFVRVQEAHDIGGGENIGYIDNGNYVEYEVDVVESGAYQVDVRVASEYGGGSIALLADGEKLDEFEVKESGDWQFWYTITRIVTLDAGSQVLRLQFSGPEGDLMNVNWMKFTLIEQYFS